MANKKTGPCKVRLVRGASYVIPGFQFKNGLQVTVSDEKALESIRRSQQFEIQEVGAADDVDSGEYEVNEEPVKPTKKKRR